MFLENESELCECRATVFFWGITLRQPVWSFTPIAIFLWKFSFRLLSTLQSILQGLSPENEKKIQQQQQQQKQQKEKKEKKLILWIYNVLKNMFIMLLS